MVSINTNLSSLIVQGNLTNSTNGLNKAIERLSTGYKINHAGDNAANYSIANKYEAKLSSYDVAADNITMGMDLLSVAQDTISTMQNHGARLQALITQARNGTYGAQSLNAMTQEAGAIISEIQRMYTNTEYNGISLFEPAKPKPPEGAGLTTDITPKYNGFIKDAVTYTKEEVAEMTSISDVDSFISGKKYSIYTADELEKFATLVNSGEDTTNVEFVLGADIDLSSIEDWHPISDHGSNQFCGTFDGNGHKINNLKSTQGGLFANTTWGSSIKNVCLKNVDATKGSLISESCASDVDNCYATGNVTGKNDVGGLISYTTDISISNCYADVTVNNNDNPSISWSYNGTGGLIGNTEGTIITNCFATGDVTSSVNNTGGLIGYNYSATTITNCYTTGNVTSYARFTGGLCSNDCIINHCYSAGNIKGESYVGGIVGSGETSIQNSYATGDVSGDDGVGGLIGCNYIEYGVDLNNVAYYGKVSGNAGVGTLIGGVDYDTTQDASNLNITGAYVLQQDVNVVGRGWSGGDDVPDPSFDPSIYLSNVNFIEMPNNEKTLQVGIHGDDSSKININTTFEYNLNSILKNISSDKAYSTITQFMSTLSEKATDLGAASNRLESALDSVLVNMENLTSSLSTVKDADMAQMSSQYIRMQILQQASATLLATANQSPSIALQLI